MIAPAAILKDAAEGTGEDHDPRSKSWLVTEGVRMPTLGGEPHAGAAPVAADTTGAGPLGGARRQRRLRLLRRRLPRLLQRTLLLRALCCGCSDHISACRTATQISLEASPRALFQMRSVQLSNMSYSSADWLWDLSLCRPVHVQQHDGRAMTGRGAKGRAES